LGHGSERYCPPLRRLGRSASAVLP
jgi:hypothetical protein